MSNGPNKDDPHLNAGNYGKQHFNPASSLSINRSNRYAAHSANG
jgi:hypothetical protein